MMSSEVRLHRWKEVRLLQIREQLQRDQALKSLREKREIRNWMVILTKARIIWGKGVKLTRFQVTCSKQFTQFSISIHTYICILLCASAVPNSTLPMTSLALDVILGCPLSGRHLRWTLAFCCKPYTKWCVTS